VLPDIVIMAISVCSIGLTLDSLAIYLLIMDEHCTTLAIEKSISSEYTNIGIIENKKK
jgi:hypothetical protein